MAAPTDVLIGVIGGTGVYKIDGLENPTQVDIDTPYGKPSDPLTVGTIHGVKCAFLARHGMGHRYLPSEIPFRANIFAMKSLGVKYLVTASACGSLREELAPCSLVVVDQFIDRTKGRPSTFFGDGIVGHVMFGDPTDPLMGGLMVQAAKNVLPDVKVHPKGTYLCMEGPAFSTRAESQMYRTMGADVIGMTALQEAKLAREAEMSYGLVALVTDYDSWRVEEAACDTGSIMEIVHKNGRNTETLVKEVIRLIGEKPYDSPSHNSLAFSIITQPDKVPAEKKALMAPLFGRYLSPA